jgi:tetratricopeptide (TPR) repeat protein
LPGSGIKAIETGHQSVKPQEDRNDRVVLLGTVIAAAVVAVYARTVHAPFVFDDIGSIADNPTIRHISTAFSPPADQTVSGRPVLNLSFAVNYAAGGLGVEGYHAVNILVHALAALVLFGLVRRTLRLVSAPRPAAAAFAASVLWAVHPLATESVSYVVQRAESLMGLLFLLTLYGIVRGAEAAAPAARRWWYAASAAACFLGMGTKEVMAAAPLVALLYDRTFLAGSFREALRRRSGLYGLLASCWVLLCGLVASAHGRGGSAGLGSGIAPLAYFLTQMPAILHYLRLAAWPSPLVFDYGVSLATPSVAVPSLAVVAVLGAATAWALSRRPAAGFLGAAFFLILAPSSSFVPVATETMAEHRMYLPLAVLAAGASALLFRVRGRIPYGVAAVAALALACASIDRNGAYGSVTGLWRATVAANPLNERAHSNLGDALEGEGRLDEALAQREEAVSLAPRSAKMHDNLGKTLAMFPSRMPEAIAEFEEALRLDPKLAEAESNLGSALTAAGRTGEAVVRLEDAVKLRPGFAPAHNNLGLAFAKLPGRSAEAAGEYREAIRINPEYAAAHNNLGTLLASEPGNMPLAEDEFAEAARLEPGYAAAHFNSGSALLALGRPAEAEREFGEAARLRPSVSAFHAGLAASILAQGGRNEQAAVQLREALRLDPSSRAARAMAAQIGMAPP